MNEYSRIKLYDDTYESLDITTDCFESIIDQIKDYGFNEDEILEDTIWLRFQGDEIEVELLYMFSGSETNINIDDIEIVSTTSLFSRLYEFDFRFSVIRHEVNSFLFENNNRKKYYKTKKGTSKRFIRNPKNTSIEYSNLTLDITTDLKKVLINEFQNHGLVEGKKELSFTSTGFNITIVLFIPTSYTDDEFSICIIVGYACNNLIQLTYDEEYIMSESYKFFGYRYQ